MVLIVDKLHTTLELGLSELNQSDTIHKLEQVKSRYLGKQGAISALMQELKNLAPEERKGFGAKVNEIKVQFENALITRKTHILELELQHKLANETIDVTLPPRGNNLGGLHPVSLSLNKMVEIFKNLGFDVADGPEIETDHYNFNALNIPANHPARAMQDTFYTSNDHVLRTHTSPMQVRYALENTPPIKVIVPGRVFRVDMDATHSPMFHQLEGLWVEEGISFANLKAVIINFLRNFFENDQLKVRFRASFFPFTEPSAEIDVQASNGKWLEVAGCGMVHPKVLSNMNIDPDKYTGFAFGIGIDRFTMLRYGIDDLRLMFENDIEFLNQFRGVN